MADILATCIIILFLFACCTQHGLKFKINGQEHTLKIEDVKK